MQMRGSDTLYSVRPLSPLIPRAMASWASGKVPPTGMRVLTRQSPTKIAERLTACSNMGPVSAHEALRASYVQAVSV